MKVLYIEDDAGLANLAKHKLETNGYQVEHAINLQVARTLLKTSSFDCVMTDYMLPDGTGLSILAESAHLSENIPWIMITGAGNEGIAVKAIQQGAVDYIVKDVECLYVDLLPSAVEKAVALKKLLQDKNKAELALTKARNKLRFLFDASIDLLLVCDQENICREVSGQALLQYGLAPDMLLNKNVFVALNIQRKDNILAFLDNDQNNAFELSVELNNWTIPMSLRMRKLADKTTLLSFRDMRDAIELKKAQNQVAQVEQEKNRIEAYSKYLSQELKLATKRKMVGNSLAFKRILKTLEQAAKVDASVLVTGETGTGKELAADMLHELSSRSEQKLIKINCAALPVDLVESEMFGHKKGAFTGALDKKVGCFEAAHQGTLVLDEIGEFPLALQAKLLRALQSGEFQPIGADQKKIADVRVVASTNRDLRAMVEQGEFREDLYYRLNVIQVHIPPLRDRPEDIQIIFRGLLTDMITGNQNNPTRPPINVIDDICTYSWPGNIRELKNYIERGLALDDWTLPTAVNRHQKVTDDSVPLNKVSDEIISTLAENERRHIIKALSLSEGVISGNKGAAFILDINANTLRARMAKLNIKLDRRPC